MTFVPLLQQCVLQKNRSCGLQEFYLGDSDDAFLFQYHAVCIQYQEHYSVDVYSWLGISLNSSCLMTLNVAFCST